MFQYESMPKRVVNGKVERAPSSHGEAGRFTP